MAMTTYTTEKADAVYEYMVDSFTSNLVTFEIEKI